MSWIHTSIGSDLAQGLSLVLTATTLCLCLYCLNRGQDLAAAYWALLVFVVPKIDGWFREHE
jgi:hypothetical protein